MDAVYEWRRSQGKPIVRDKKLETDSSQKRGLEEEACNDLGSIWAIAPYLLTY